LILEKGFKTEYGARPLRRSIQTLIEDPISELFLNGTLKKGLPITVGVEEGKIVFTQPTLELPLPTTLTSETINN